MSFPLARSPTLNEYLRWAERQGFRVLSGVRSDPSGRPNSIVRIEVPATGRHVIIAGMREMSERLTSSKIAYLDRRLGVESGFPSIEGYGVEPPG